jgi:hypothetical protein
MEGRIEVEIHYTVPLFLSNRQEVAIKPTGGIVDQRIDAPKPDAVIA